MSKFGVWQDVQSCPDGDVWFALTCGHVVMGYKQGPHLLDWEASIDHDCCADASAIKAQPVEPPKHPSLPPAPGEQVGEPAMVVEQLASGAIDVLERSLPIGVHKLYTAPPSTSALVEALEKCLPYLEDGENCGDEAKELAPMVRAALAAHRKETA